MERACRAGQNGNAVRLLREGSREPGRTFTEAVLQEVIDGAGTQWLGARRSGSARNEVSPW